MATLNSNTSVNQFAYVVAAIVLVLVLAASAPKYAGWLLIMLVMGMVYAAHSRGLL